VAAVTEPSLGAIPDVQVRDLELVPNERGHLLEIARNDDDWFPGFGQVYATSTEPGIIKGWYRHTHQADTLTLVSGHIRLVLFDDRTGSTSRGVTQTVEMGLDRPCLVVIPALIWHGFQNTGATPALIVHVNSVPFDFAEPDEERRDVDDPSMPNCWIGR
jgi:dTDP-4-dehydrorhamnose 3,5-epimerase